MSQDVAHSATAHGMSRYLRSPREIKYDMAICLSGGGFRAALYHMGALRRLNELGVLSQVTTISSVSGGSILNGLLASFAEDWPESGKAFEDWDRRVTQPMRAFTSQDIRTPALLRPMLKGKFWFGDGPVDALATAYRSLCDRSLSDLPDRPRFIFCATDVNFGDCWTFDSGGSLNSGGCAGDYQAGYASPLDGPKLNLNVAHAMAGSSCFPPVFNPLHLGIPAQRLIKGKYKKKDRDKLAANIGLSDGGVYDNFGLEPVWKDHRCLLVSDGGGVFRAQPDTGLFWRLTRYAGIQGNQVSNLHKRWLISSYIKGVLDGAYWGIGSSADHYDFRGHFYSEGLVDDVISAVRTDLDTFSDPEQKVLENHGYIMAEAAIQQHAPERIAINAPFKIPNEEWMNEEAIRVAMSDSSKTKILGR